MMDKYSMNKKEIKKKMKKNKGMKSNYSHSTLQIAQMMKEKIKK